jgi:hypothetical protein
VQKVSIYIICFSLKYINTCLFSCNFDVLHWIYSLLFCDHHCRNYLVMLFNFSYSFCFVK